MDLTQLANFGEFIGGVAVLVTLVYLAVQVRAGNTLARDNASHNWTEFNFALITGVVEDRSLAELWVRAGSDFRELDKVDQQRVMMFEWRALEAWHHAFHQRRQGFFADYQWEKVMAIIQGPIGNRESVREAWQAFQSTYDQEFCDFVERNLGKH